MFATNTRVKLRVAKRILQKPKEAGTVKLESKRIGLLYSEPTESVVRQEHRKSVKVIVEARPNVSFDISLPNLTNNYVNVPMNMLLSAFCISIVNTIDT